MEINDIVIDQQDGCFEKMRLLFTGEDGTPSVKIYVRPVERFDPARPAFLLTASLTDGDFNALAHPLTEGAPAVAAPYKTITLGLAEVAVRTLTKMTPKDANKEKGVLTVSRGRLYECHRVGDLMQPFSGDPADLEWADMGPVAKDVTPAWCDIQCQLVPACRDLAEAAARWWQRIDAMSALGAITAP
ncbi:hypothetical protein [Kordiimonas marina]|uniref:hypothetical protein n=1 Tax=Kordiimonas marina TaxID=2872312 RepID=UPI001FF3E0EA|nr:hypothetical protein [Kordiimonas marina]MCJ9428701.1 hypothetical protein [Kordiimonas marina]